VQPLLTALVGSGCDCGCASRRHWGDLLWFHHLSSIAAGLYLVNITFVCLV
jgi:hypothetical protein